MEPAFDILPVNGHELLLSERGIERRGSLLVHEVLRFYAPSGRGAYRGFLLSFINFRMVPDEERWTFLFESVGAVRRRVIRWARETLRLTLAPAGFNDGTFDVTRPAKVGPVNHFARAFSVVRRLYAIAQDDERQLRPVGNPLSVNRWDTWDYDRRYDWVVKRHGPKHAHYLVRSAGTFFNIRDTTTYVPPMADPEGLGERMFRAMVDLLGEHPAADIAGVLRDDGPRWSDVAEATFEDYALSGFDRVIMGTNKNGARDGDTGKRIPDKPIAISVEVRDRIHSRIDAEHAANTSLPSMAQLRVLLDEGKLDELARYPLFAKPRTTSAYSYEGYRRLEQMAMAKANLTVTQRGKKRLVTSRWARRTLHEREWLEIHETSKDEAEIRRRLARLTHERGHKTPQHHAYASHGKHKLAVKSKMERQDREEAARKAAAEAAMNGAPEPDRPSEPKRRKGRWREG